MNKFEDSAIIDNISKSFLLHQLSDIIGVNRKTLERNFYRLGGSNLDVIDILYNNQSILELLTEDSSEPVESIQESLFAVVEEELSLSEAVAEVKNTQNQINIKPLLEKALYAVVNGRKEVAMVNLVKAMETLSG